MIWTDEQDERGGVSLLQGFINAIFGCVTIIAGALVIVGALFAPGADGWQRAGAALIGITTVVCGGLMARRD